MRMTIATGSDTACRPGLRVSQSLVVSKSTAESGDKLRGTQNVFLPGNLLTHCTAPANPSADVYPGTQINPNFFLSHHSRRGCVRHSSALGRIHSMKGNVNFFGLRFLELLERCRHPSCRAENRDFPSGYGWVGR